MSSIALALLCIQVFLAQTAFGQIGWCEDAHIMSPFNYAPAIWASSYPETFGPYGYGALEYAGPFVEGVAAAPVSYGGAGIGEVAVAGELPAGGATAVAGQVPILGAVEFAGPVRAAGTITIAGTCGCGCGGTFIY